jgi:hypothetical protein
LVSSVCFLLSLHYIVKYYKCCFAHTLSSLFFPHDCTCLAKPSLGVNQTLWLFFICTWELDWAGDTVHDHTDLCHYSQWSHTAVAPTLVICFPTLCSWGCSISFPSSLSAHGLLSTLLGKLKPPKKNFYRLLHTQCLPRNSHPGQ